jgi:hypothetical protein
MFFQGNDRVHETMHRVAQKLEAGGIRYAIVGGMAVNAHGHQRTTGDVGFLLTAEGFDAFRKLIEAAEFSMIPGRPRRFLDRANGITFDFLVTGMFPGSGRPGPIAYPDPAVVGEVSQGRTFVNLPTLIQLKLAARRYKDLGDVVELMGTHNLDEAFANQLAPSVRGDYIECLEEKRREDEYEARQDEQFEQKTRSAGGENPPSGTSSTSLPGVIDWARMSRLMIPLRHSLPSSTDICFRPALNSAGERGPEVDRVGPAVV